MFLKITLDPEQYQRFSDAAKYEGVAVATWARSSLIRFLNGATPTKSIQSERPTREPKEPKPQVVSKRNKLRDLYFEVADRYGAEAEYDLFRLSGAYPPDVEGWWVRTSLDNGVSWDFVERVVETPERYEVTPVSEEGREFLDQLMAAKPERRLDKSQHKLKAH